jgi:putative transposase
MPRIARRYLPDGFVHVTQRGNRRHDLFLAERDWCHHLELLEDVIRRYHWRCHAFCLMTNHFHLLLEVEREALSEGMRRLNGLYAQYFNRQYRLDGHVFQGRFKSRPVTADRHLLETVRYILRNPIRAALCEHPADWAWSSYCATLSLPSPAAFFDPRHVLALFGTDDERARERFAEFVSATTMPAPEAPRNTPRVDARPPPVAWTT